MKYAVVTGSTKGIGRAIAEKLLKEGYCVIANYAFDDAGADAFQQENAEYGDRLFVIKKELSTYEAAVSFVERVKEITMCLDCLVLNCGMTDRSRFDDITKESWERVMNVNINAPFYLVQGLKAAMRPQAGRIIFIGSVCGQFPHSVSLGYGVTKAAIHQMAKELTKVFCDQGVTVNAIAPGFVDTEWQKSKSVDQRRRIEEKTALKRFGKPEEVADLCYQVICNQLINGAVLNIDGGYCYR